MSQSNSVQTIIVAIAVACCFASGSARAEHSNKQQVLTEMQDGGYHVIVLKNWTEGDWVKSGSAIGGSIATGNPGPVMAYIDQELDVMATKLKGHFTKDRLRELVMDAIRGRKLPSRLHIEVGIKTIDRWDEFTYDEPRTRVKTGKFGIKYLETYLERVTKKVNLPNWHMLYIRYKIS